MFPILNKLNKLVSILLSENPNRVNAGVLQVYLSQQLAATLLTRAHSNIHHRPLQFWHFGLKACRNCWALERGKHILTKALVHWHPAHPCFNIPPHWCLRSLGSQGSGCVWQRLTLQTERHSCMTRLWLALVGRWMHWATSACHLSSMSSGGAVTVAQAGTRPGGGDKRATASV